MKRLGKTAIIVAAVFLLGLIPAASLAAADAPVTVSIMTRTFSGDPIRDDAEAKKLVEDYCNVKLKITWVPSTLYTEKVNITLASGDMPMILLTGSNKDASIVKAVNDGAFWEIGPYLKEYKNLSKALPITLWNSSFNGKTYGLYSNRPLGRNGIIYRDDWAKKLGIKEPKTIDDFYKMLVAFRDKDPDGNGKADTYGMVVPYVKNNPIVFKQTLVWFGGPFDWGIAKDGTLQPAHLFPEYMEALKFWRKMFAEKLINADFATYDPNKWKDAVIADKAGVIVDVVNTRSNEINKIFAETAPEKSVDVFGAVAGPKGLRLQATSGFGSIFLFSKGAIKDVAMLKKVLAFEDKLSDKFCQDTCNYGVQGKHWELVEGYVKTRAVTDTTYPKNDWNDFNQILTFIPPENITLAEMKPWVKKYEQLMLDNAKIAVGNPASPFSSPTEGMRGAQLSAILEEIYVKFTAGQIDEKGVEDLIALWRKTGGDDVIKEYNEQFKKYGMNAPK